MLFELTAVGDLEVGVDGAQALWVHLHLDLILFGGHSNEGMEGIANGAGVSAADVVILAGNRVYRHQHIIGADGVPDISVGAQGVQIANLHYRGDKAFLDHGDLLGEGGFVEYIAPAGAGVGEHPGGHDSHAVGFGIIAAHQIGTDLGDSIGGGGMEGAVFVDAILRLHLWGDLSKDLGGCTDMDNSLAFRNAQGLQKIAGSDDVGVQGVDGRVKAGFGVALGGQVEDIVRLYSFDDGEQRDHVIEVGILEKDTVFVVGPLEEVLDIIDGAAPAADAMDIPVGVF